MGMCIKKHIMRLYSLNRDEVTLKRYEELNGIELICVTKESLLLNRAYCAKRYRMWNRNVCRGMKGVFAVSEGMIVGHAWLKTKGSMDTFYLFGDKIGYISEVFVDEHFRGKGIAPAMMARLILDHSEYESFYISSRKSNIPSRKALLKVGFSYVRSIEFIRAFKITWNKFKIT